MNVALPCNTISCSESRQQDFHDFAALFVRGIAASCLRTLGTRRALRLVLRENLSQIYLLFNCEIV